MRSFSLVALGIDYNIILVSRFMEERKTHRVKEALEIAIRNTGGVISSAGIILAATFAALTTMPIADLFVFGFIDCDWNLDGYFPCSRYATSSINTII